MARSAVVSFPYNQQRARSLEEILPKGYIFLLTYSHSVQLFLVHRLALLIGRMGGGESEREQHRLALIPHALHLPLVYSSVWVAVAPVFLLRHFLHCAHLMRPDKAMCSLFAYFMTYYFIAFF